jgi:hypothetical protein
MVAFVTTGRALLAALAAEADIELARTAMVRLVVVGFAAPPLPGVSDNVTGCPIRRM